MDKSKRDLIIIVGGLAFLVVFLGKGLLPKNKPRAAGSAASGALADVSFLTSIRESEKIREQQNLSWDKEWARDPFAVKGLGPGATEGVSHLILSGIVWDEKTPMAVINERVVSAGGSIGGVKIVEIRPNSVVVLTEDGEQEVEIKLFQASANKKQAPSA